MRLLFFLLFLSLACGLTGCTVEPEHPSSPDAPPFEEHTISPAPPDSTAPASPDTASATWTGNPIEVERPTDEATLRAVRTAAHDGFDRVVFEFAEAELPSYRVAFTEAPVQQCASGNPMVLDGAHRVEVRFSRTRAHTAEGLSTVTDRDLAPYLPRLRALTLTCDFEGVVTWVLGLGAPGPYRVAELSEPTRLVVDVLR